MAGKGTIRRGLTEDRVEQLDLQDALKVHADSTVRHVINAMRDARTGCALLESGGQVTGIFTERDFLHRIIIPDRDLDTPVTEVMTEDPSAVLADETVWRAIEMMQRGGFRHLPVREQDGRIERLCALKVILTYLAEYFPDKVYNLPPDSSKAPPTREGA